MDLVFDDAFSYGRGGLVLVAAGMGLYLGAATLNQAALARGRARRVAACWLASEAAFVVFLLLPGFEDRVFQGADRLRRRRGRPLRPAVRALPRRGRATC